MTEGKTNKENATDIVLERVAANGNVREIESSILTSMADFLSDKYDLRFEHNDDRYYLIAKDGEPEKVVNKLLDEAKEVEGMTDNLRKYGTVFMLPTEEGNTFLLKI